MVPAPTSDRLAFLHVQDGNEGGFIGGLLVVNGMGRPLEFHCTAPFLPTPTQRILYGTTLDSFVFCEQVGTALIQQLKHRPRAILVQQARLLELAESSPWPWVWLPEQPGAEIQPLPIALRNQRLFTWDQRNAIVTGHETLLDDASAYCAAFGQRLPLDEPFERIRQALDLALEQAR
ncbi:MAG TPA: hypothetical protein PKD54_12225 [Pirellulaceae bacterium]|nr:hypothetical protein [Pirellulaceae bacterium]